MAIKGNLGVQIGKIDNANVYINGNNLLGQVEEIKIPDIVATVTEYKSLGLIGKFELPSGFEKMEGELKLKSVFPNILKICANVFEVFQMQVRCNVQTWDASGLKSETPLVTHIYGYFKKPGTGTTLKMNERAEFSAGYTCHYLKQVFDGVDMFEIDYFNTIYIVDGVDLMANYRSALGI